MKKNVSKISRYIKYMQTFFITIITFLDIDLLSRNRRKKKKFQKKLFLFLSCYRDIHICAPNQLLPKSIHEFWQEFVIFMLLAVYIYTQLCIHINI